MHEKTVRGQAGENGVYGETVGVQIWGDPDIVKNDIVFNNVILTMHVFLEIQNVVFNDVMLNNVIVNNVIPKKSRFWIHTRPHRAPCDLRYKTL